MEQAALERLALPGKTSLPIPSFRSMPIPPTLSFGFLGYGVIRPSRLIS